MSIYDDMQVVSKELLSEFDQGGIYYLKTTKGAGPADNPGVPTTERFKVDGTARAAEYKFIDGTNITAKTLQVNAAPDDRYEPDLSDNIEVKGQTYRIIAHMPTPATGTVIVHKFLLER